MDECTLLWLEIAFFGVKIYFYNRYFSHYYSAFNYRFLKKLANKTIFSFLKIKFYTRGGGGGGGGGAKKKKKKKFIFFFFFFTLFQITLKKGGLNFFSPSKYYLNKL
jgi:hypothetical protein